MSDYIKLRFRLEPCCEDATDLLASFLGDIGFESFENLENGLDAYVVKSRYNETDVNEIIKFFPIKGDIEFETEEIPHQDWNEEWEKKYFKPILIGNGKCVIHSTFHKDYPEADYEIIVDPKMAFGTGHHATTTMMANFLLEMDLKGKKVLDMGTGTGILAIIAKKQGASEVTGIEIDPDACENARENAALNNTDITLLTGDAENLKDYRGVDIFMANINRNIILADIGSYVNTLHKGSLLFLSGFYKSDVEMIEGSLTQHGMKITEVKVSEGDWASIKAVKL